jgi:predicted Rossmann fold nucleotide-binding protein DprA/Smf involved in DNA uptake
MRYGIVGSRERSDRHSVESFVSGLSAGDTVISGGCRGVDTWAEECARGRGLEVIVLLPEPTAGGGYYAKVREYHARNRRIAEACDVLVAFVSTARKGGTENTIAHARRAGKPVVIL